MKVLFFVFIFIFSQFASALTIHSEVEKEYLALGGNAHALSHLKCFLENYAETDFDLRDAKLFDRCNGMSNGNKTIQLNSSDYVTIVDYTKPSTQRRLFVLDLENPKPPYVESFYVSHGRYKNTSSLNTTPGVGKNTIKWIDYYSNVKSSNASSSGFYITGQTYQGRWTGPKKDKFSLIIHGINTDLNDNACDRAVVVHGNTYIKESGKKEGVGKMSSGCFMLDYNLVNSVIEKIRGGGGDHHTDEDHLGGTLFFTYSKKEASESSHLYCSSQSKNLLRIK